MTADLKPYPVYKPSGIEWLGDVPTHWEVRRLKHVCSRYALYGANIAATHYEETGVRFLRTTDVTDDGRLKKSGVFLPQELVRDHVLNDGDILISRSGTIGRSFLYQSELHGPCSYAGYLVRFVPDSLTLPKYVFLFTKTQAFEGFLRVVAISSTIENVNADKYSNAHLPLPPLPEQAAIVRYLDHVDERIRRYVSGKQKLIRLLEEEKQAVIHHAVTRGLPAEASAQAGRDPDVRLKPSGVEWLGDVPAHWKVRRVKQASRILRGKFTHRPRNDPSLYEGPYPFIQTGDVARAKKTITGYSQTLNKQGLAVSMMFPTGTLVMTIAANIGDVAVLDFEACFPDSVVGFVPSQNVDRDYLYYLFRAMKTELLRETPVNTQGNLNVDRIGSRHIPLPPLPEQTAIVRYLDKATADIDTAIDRAHRQISLLREYRTRLIADVVTGQLDVRGAAASLSDEVERLGEIV